jgi:glycerate kinase
MRVLIATNAMKGSLTAAQFSKAVAEGLHHASETFQTIILPVADGGDSSAEVLVNHFAGEFVPVKVHDPLGRLIDSRFGWIPGKKTAIIEMAEASGLKLISNEERNPMITSSFGTGELIKAAVENGAERIILGLGGSATVDGGVGLIMALGAEITDINGDAIQPGGKGLLQIKNISVNHVAPELFRCRIDIISDVSNPLSGNNGAAFVFGPQKGATKEQVQLLDDGLVNLSQLIFRQTGFNLLNEPSLGSAGGCALPIIAYLNGKLFPGANLILDLLDFEHYLFDCVLVITGEGNIDLQTLHGKGPMVVAERAHKAGIPVIALGGGTDYKASSAFDAMFSVINQPMTTEQAMKNAYSLVRNQAFEIGRLIKIFKK